MTKKRFTRHKSLDRDCTIYDELKDFQFPSLPLGVSEIFCDKLNELDSENKELKELLELISRAHSFKKEESVKEILRNEIKGIDTVTEYSAMAWNVYCTLSNFFKKQYGEHWDNE